MNRTLRAHTTLCHQPDTRDLSLHSTNASAALDNGMRALQTYFRKYGTDIEIEPFVSRIVGSLDRFGVLG